MKQQLDHEGNPLTYWGGKEQEIETPKGKLGIYVKEIKKQTAIEWLKDKLKETYDKEGKLPIAYTLHLVDLANLMEIERIKKAFSDGQETPLNHPTLPHYSSEEYYNDNYK